jgi:hypothetical protein
MRRQMAWPNALSPMPQWSRLKISRAT